MTPILNHILPVLTGRELLRSILIRCVLAPETQLHHSIRKPRRFAAKEIQLDDQSLEEKLVTARRGGTVLSRMACLSGCYASWGLTSQLVRARSVIKSASITAAHPRLLLVELEGEKWIADVGFGGRR